MNGAISAAISCFGWCRHRWAYFHQCFIEGEEAWILRLILLKGTSCQLCLLSVLHEDADPVLLTLLRPLLCRLEGLQGCDLGDPTDSLLEETHVIEGVLIAAAPVYFENVSDKVLWAQLMLRICMIHVLEVADISCLDLPLAVLGDDRLPDALVEVSLVDPFEELG